MTENMAIAPVPTGDDSFQFSFTIVHNRAHLTGDYVDIHVARGYETDDGTKWEIDGISSFEAIDLVPPVAGQDLIPYLVHHILEARDWLMEEHAKRFIMGTVEKISASVGVPQLPGIVR
jgi:hypothetical protein